MDKKLKVAPEDALEKVLRRRAKLDAKAAELRVSIRKREDRKKHMLGGLVVKAGLQDISQNVILGIMVAGARRLALEKDGDIDSQGALKSFENLGREKFEQDEKAREVKKASVEKAKARPSLEPKA